MNESKTIQISDSRYCGGELMKKPVIRIWRKAYTQRVIRAIRDAGWMVKRNKNGIYYCYNFMPANPQLIFSAAAGQRDYLVSISPDLMEGIE